ncbi:RadC family protein [Chitinimonas lacunae]|uniref:DNA repair protein RadC n=1 Tax=Chitinimonas lacunae TaxID=1963018 RepID=A0ABV8MTN0_9NEIS
MTLHDWPAEERPREKLLRQGSASLSDAELLAIFLRVGLPGKNAVELARELLNRFGSLQALLRADLAALSDTPGMGRAKYAQLQAVQELARRALGESLQRRTALDRPAAVHDYLRLWLGNRTVESFVALFLDTRLCLLASEELSSGTVDQTAVYPREVARRALAHGASALIVAHNHPSGDPEPSRADVLLTRRLSEALALLDIRLIDHLVVAQGAAVSLRERGLVEFQ